MLLLKQIQAPLLRNQRFDLQHFPDEQDDFVILLLNARLQGEALAEVEEFLIAQSAAPNSGLRFRSGWDPVL